MESIIDVLTFSYIFYIFSWSQTSFPHRLEVSTLPCIHSYLILKHKHQCIARRKQYKVGSSKHNHFKMLVNISTRVKDGVINSFCYPMLSMLPTIQNLWVGTANPLQICGPTNWKEIPAKNLCNWLFNFQIWPNSWKGLSSFEKF